MLGTVLASKAPRLVGPLARKRSKRCRTSRCRHRERRGSPCLQASLLVSGPTAIITPGWRGGVNVGQSSGGWIRWVVIATALTASVTVVSLIVGVAVDKEVTVAARVGLALFGCMALAAGLIDAGLFDTHRRSIRGLMRPQALSGIALAILTAFGALTDAVSLLSPRPVVESEPLKIERQLQTLVDHAEGKTTTPSMALAKIPGVWGEPGCGVTFRFAVEGKALNVTAEKLPPGAAPYQLIAVIDHVEHMSIVVHGEHPAEARGRAASFTLASIGGLERLVWDDKSLPTPVELDRCS